VLVPHIAGAVLLFWLARVHVNEAAVMGLLLLLGIAVNSGVLLEEWFLRLVRSGSRRPAAALRAVRERSPAVMLTAVTSILALLPLWLTGVNQVGRPFVAVLGGGLLLGTPLTLLMVPALQSLSLRRQAGRSITWRGDGFDFIKLRSLSKTYGGNIRALKGVTTTIESGMVGLLGPNGAGKTTLLRCFVGALSSDTGDVWVNDIPRREDREGFRSLVGYLPQSQEVPGHLEVAQWLTLWGGEMDLKDPEKKARESLAILDVEDLSKCRLEDLSGVARR